MIPPGGTIGILGGGQLGRMSVLAGRRMGYRFHVYDPEPTACAAPVADVFVNAAFEDEAALEVFASQVDVVTLEFENIPIEVLQRLEWNLPVRPDSRVLGVCQNREAEKCYLRDRGFPCAPFAVVDSLDELKKAFAGIGKAAVLKTARFGYDGKGQYKLNSKDDLEHAWKQMGGARCVIEKWIQHQGEYSLICARNRRGEISLFPMAENAHRNHILDVSVVPVPLEKALIEKAEELARVIAGDLGVVGILAVELFLDEEGEWLVNELAPRPHNSGHYTIDACATSQFEQHIRAVCDLPLGETQLLRPVAMLNVLGDAWPQGGVPDWEGLLQEPDLKLHLYDKGEAKRSRKMGHVCVFGEDAEEVRRRALALRARLYPEG